MEKSDSLNIVMLPWVSFSHLKPFLELSKVIAPLGHHVYFISTKPKIQTLEAQESSNPYLHLVSLSGEDTESFQEPLTGFLQNASFRVHWILYDAIPYWVPSVAARFGARSANVCVVSATANAFMWPLLQEHTRPDIEQLTSPHDWAPAGTNMAFHAYEVPYVLGQMFKTDASGLSLANRIQLSMSGADVVAVRSSTELEGEWLQCLSNLCHKPVLALGHLPPQTSTDVSTRPEIFTWLETQNPGSVLYVAFGSELILSPNQVEELAYGIENSGLPFIWALRCPDDPPAGLSEDFQERTKDRGLLCQGWVPQVDILAHRAIGGFLSHCGWNSMLEALQFGVPLVMLPLYHDEFLNARLITYNKVGVEIPRKEEDGSFARDDMAKTMRLVMVSPKGQEVRARAKEMKGIFSAREFHESYVKKFVGHLLENRLVRE